MISLSVSGQKEGFYWYFGQKAGIHFQEDGSDPTPSLNCKISTNEGCSTISDEEGKLLFYTDGVTVYNRKHEIMSGGTNLYGHASSTQSGVIVPVPNKPNIYYIFTVSELSAKDTKGFRYSIVNMDHGDGLGAVTDKNILLFEETTERVTAVKHTNDFGVWVIAHECGSSRFFSYLVTPSGIDPNVVISDVGVVHTHLSASDDSGKGYMKASPTFNKLAVAIEELGIVELFDFDKSTGILSNPIDLVFGSEVYGVEFSEDAFYLYATKRNGVDVCQWDLGAGSEQQINDSKIIVGTLQNSTTGALQIGPNGKIYMAVKNKPWLSSINAPTLGGLSCDFQEKAITWSSTDHYCVWGLPTFIQSFFKTFWFTVENECIGDEIKFSPNSIDNLEMIEWNFGDPASASGDTSTLFYPMHVYSQPGEYTITAKFYYLNTYQSYSKKIEILYIPEIQMGNDITICQGDTAEIEIFSNHDVYIWNGNYISEPFLNVSEEGPVIVGVENACGSDSDEVYIYVQPLPEVDLGPDLEMKYREYVALDAGSHFAYRWIDGTTENYCYPASPGEYWVEVWDALGCKSSDTIMITPVPFSFHVPTAFSPNGDDLNPTFEIYTSYDLHYLWDYNIDFDIDFDFEFYVFNRWGQEVFYTNDFNEVWDGTYNNIPCPTEVYTWILVVKMEEENEFFTKSTQLTGNVTLVR